MKPFRLWILGLLTGWLPETRFFALKARLLRWCGAQVGENVRICSSAVFRGNGKLVIGDDVWIGAQSYISPVGNSVIRIGNCCDIAPRVMLLTGTHAIDPAGPHIGGAGKSASTFVGDGCWLGAASVILPGVSLADKTLVAAGAVVTRTTTNECCLIAGVPACVKKCLQ